MLPEEEGRYTGQGSRRAPDASRKPGPGAQAGMQTAELCMPGDPAGIPLGAVKWKGVFP